MKVLNWSIFRGVCIAVRGTESGIKVFEPAQKFEFV